MRLPVLFASLLLAVFVALASLAPANTWRSALYPENWQRPSEDVSFYTDTLIQDFSYAGYRRGEAPIPTITGPIFNVVTTYGADATGATDSTVAIQTAINAAAAAGGGVVYLPAGTFRVSPQSTNTFALRVSTSNIVLRGAGIAETFLLNTSYTMNGKAVLQVSPPSVSLGTTRNITADLNGPTRRIPVANASSFAVGNIVRLQWNFTPEWVAEHNQQTWWGEVAPTSARYIRQVVAINPTEGWIEIDIPTRYTMKTRDSAIVRTLSGLLTNVGVESLAIGNVQHPGTGWGEEDYTDPTKAAYDTHNSYLIRFQNVRDSWITSAQSRQATTNTTTAHLLSNGILLSECARVTVQASQMRRPQYGGGGGNGYMFRLQSSNDCLVRNCVAEFSRHGLVINNAGTSGNVFFQCQDRETQRATGSTGSYTTSGSGSDNHQTFSHSNLWDQCLAHNSFYTAHHRGFFGSTPPHGLTSAHGVYWNISGSGTRYTDIVRSEQARYGYVIGTSGTRSGATNPTGGNTAPADILEGIGLGTTLSPQSLYLDQFARRLTPAVLYSANGATNGTAPLDAFSPYSPNHLVTVLGAGNLVKTGFFFSGWNTSPDGNGTSYAAGITFAITGTTYLYAQWLGQPYTVTFNTQGGSPATPTNKSVEFGSPYGPLAVTTRSGYTLVGWFTASSGGTRITASSNVTLGANHTLYARWNARPSTDAGPNQSVSLSSATLWTPSEINPRAWYDASAPAGIAASGSNVTQWLDQSGNGRHLSVAGSGSPQTGTNTLNGLNAIRLSGNGLVRTSFPVNSNGNLAIFTAAQVLSTTSEFQSLVSMQGTNNFQFDAGNNSAFNGRINVTNIGTTKALTGGPFTGPSAYAMVFDKTGSAYNAFIDGTQRTTATSYSTHLSTSQTFRVGINRSANQYLNSRIGEVILTDDISLTTRQTAEGYLAHKWGFTAKLPANHPYKILPPGSPTSTVSLAGAATDLENDSLNYTWSVVSGAAPVTFANTASAQTTATFTVAGSYTLRLTSTDGFGSSFDDVVITVGNETSYTVTYHGNGATGGTAPVDLDSPYAPDSTVTVLGAGDLVRAGYSFGGWNTAANGSGTTLDPDDTVTASGSVTLYAKWQPIHLIVTFDAQGGTAPEPTEIQTTFSSTYGPLPTSSRAGFSFAGWFTALTGGDLINEESSVTLLSDHTLSARWNALPTVDAGPPQTLALDVLEPWTPTPATTAAWYDAADASTITANSNAVSQWADKSGQANHLAQATAGNQPATGTRTLGGRNVVAFNAANDHFMDALHSASLNFDASGGLSTFIVFRSPGYNDQGGGSNHVFGKGSPFSAAGFPGFGLSYNANFHPTFKFADADTRSLTLGGDFQDSSLLFSTTANHATGAQGLYLNGGSLSGTRIATPPRTSDNSGNFRVGGIAPTYAGGPSYSTTTRYADVDIGELLLVPGALALADRQRIEGYLAHKWGLASSLPVTHPHKSQSPGSFVAIANLTGTATDAEGDPLTHQWSVVFGPASVIFGDASALSTTATFPVEGSYTLRLTSTDGSNITFDELVITVGDTPPPGAFETWAGGGEVTFAGDANGDGIADGLAWLLGAEFPSTHAAGLLPAQNTGAHSVSFRYLVAAKRGSSTLRLQHSATLAADSWTDVAIPDESGSVDGVEFLITPVPASDLNQIQATLPPGGAGRVFIRLAGELPGS